MAKKVQVYVKLQIVTGMANPNPPVGPALDQQGANIMEFCKAFNVKTDSVEKSLSIPVVIAVRADRSFTFVIKTPPATVLLKKAAGIESGSGRLNKNKMGKISHAQLQEIAQTKATDMTGADIEVITRSIEGTARSMGLVVGDQEMAELTKRMRVICERVGATKQYDISEVTALLKELATTKFVKSADVAVNLSIDARKSDQNVRGTTVLSHGTGRPVRVVAFTQGVSAEAAKAAGAELVGMEDPAEQTKKGGMNLDAVITSPDIMCVVGQLGQTLDSRGLMPSPKVGTIMSNTVETIKNAKADQIRYRSGKNGIVHTAIGKVDSDADKLREDLEALLAALREVEPIQAKGVYIKRVSTFITMSVGVIADQAGLSASID